MKNSESQALYDVWKWKEKAYEEVAHLPLHLALKKRLEDSVHTVQQLGLAVSNTLKDVPLTPVAHQ